jgi:hypothetical protein
MRAAGLTAVIAVMALPGCGAASTTTSSPPSTPTAAATAAPTPTELPASFGYLGATVAQFKAAHGAASGPGDICSAVNACFGHGLVNAETGPGPTFEFITVSVTSGIIDGYSMEFPTGTSILAAKSYVLEWLPRDAVTTLYKIAHINGSCVLWNVRSSTLARVLGLPTIGDPQGDLGIVLGYVTPDLTNLYDANNVEHANISVLPNAPTDGC